MLEAKPNHVSYPAKPPRTVEELRELGFSWVNEFTTHWRVDLDASLSIPLALYLAGKLRFPANVNFVSHRTADFKPGELVLDLSLGIKGKEAGSCFGALSSLLCEVDKARLKNLIETVNAFDRGDRVKYREVSLGLVPLLAPKDNDSDSSMESCIRAAEVLKLLLSVPPTALEPLPTQVKGALSLADVRARLDAGCRSFQLPRLPALSHVLALSSCLLTDQVLSSTQTFSVKFSDEVGSATDVIHIGSSNGFSIPGGKTFSAILKRLNSDQAKHLGGFAQLVAEVEREQLWNDARLDAGLYGLYRRWLAKGAQPEFIVLWAETLLPLYIERSREREERDRQAYEISDKIEWLGSSGKKIAVLPPGARGSIGLQLGAQFAAFVDADNPKIVGIIRQREVPHNLQDLLAERLAYDRVKDLNATSWHLSEFLLKWNGDQDPPYTHEQLARMLNEELSKTS